MPEQTGISFLIELNDSASTQPARKVLLTGQAGLEDTVEAVNHSSLHFYMAKPWQGESLRDVIKKQLTLYMIENNADLMPWAAILDTEKILDAIAKNESILGNRSPNHVNFGISIA